MIAIRLINGYGFPYWGLPQSINVKRSGPTWTPAKEIFVKRSGPTWTKIWHENNWGPVNTQHPHWEYAFNFDFLKTTDTNSDPSWVSISTEGAGFYNYPTSGQLRMNIGSRDANGFGALTLEANQPLRVNPGQQYRHVVTVNARTSGTRIALRAYTAVARADANLKSSSVFQTTPAEVAAGSQVESVFNIPSGHNWVRLYMYIESSLALPRNYTLSQWRFRRNS